MLENMSNQELLTAWQGDDQQAAQVLVRRYMARLTALARSRLSRKLSRRLDPEDVVLSAWRSFFVAIGDGRLGVPADDNLWPLLVTLTLRKLSHQAARHTTQQRDVTNEVSLDPAIGWPELVSREPSPVEAALVVSEVERLLSLLDKKEREVLSRRLQGEEASAIAAAMGLSERTIRRSLQRIRERFIELHSADGPSVATTRTAPDRSLQRPSEPVLPETSGYKGFADPSIDYSDLLLQRLIGQGAFGKVYMARWLPEERDVAVKFLKRIFWKDRRSVRSMLEETTITASLSHPNIIRHHGWGLTPQGGFLIVMDWIEGRDALRWRNELRPSLVEIVSCVCAVADALTAAHAVGVIHGDVTPGNILCRDDGTFVLTDFGFARRLRDASGSLGGTPGFLAPEQVSDAFGPINERTDVYGLGGLAYSLLTGHPPMAGRDVPETLANVLSSRCPLPVRQYCRDIPEELERLVMDCLKKEPTERPVSIAEIGALFRRLLIESGEQSDGPTLLRSDTSVSVSKTQS